MFNKAKVTFVSLMISVAPAGAETLTDAFVTAYKSSGLIAQNRAVLRAADEDVASAVTALRPVLNYAAGVNYNEPSSGSNTSASLSLSASMLLYDFGRTEIGIDAGLFQRASLGSFRAPAPKQRASADGTTARHARPL